MPEQYDLVEAAMKIIQDHRSIRQYADEPVSEEHLEMIMEAARQAPSGENAQPWRFIIVKDQATRKQLGAIAGGGSGRRFTAEFVTKKMQERFKSLEDEAKKKAIFEELTSRRVSFVTSPGYLRGNGGREAAGLRGGPSRVITDMAVFGFDPESKRMRLESIHPNTTLNDVLSNMNFEPIAPGELPVTAPPTAEQVRLIREEIDPQGMYAGS